MSRPRPILACVGLAIIAYVLIGVFTSGLMARAVPATSMAGRAYLAATWPCWVKGSPIPHPPVGAWAFDFDKAPDHA